MCQIAPQETFTTVWLLNPISENKHKNTDKKDMCRMYVGLLRGNLSKSRLKKPKRRLDCKFRFNIGNISFRWLMVGSVIKNWCLNTLFSNDTQHQPLKKFPLFLC